MKPEVVRQALMIVVAIAIAIVAAVALGQAGPGNAATSGAMPQQTMLIPF